MCSLWLFFFFVYLVVIMKIFNLITGVIYYKKSLAMMSNDHTARSHLSM